MSRPVGGRGYKGVGTVHIRIPLPIEDKVRKLVNEFYEDPKNQQETREGDKLVNKLPSLEEIVPIAQEVLSQKKSARLSLSKLLEKIYGREIKL